LLCPATAVFFLLCCLDASQGAVLSFALEELVPELKGQGTAISSEHTYEVTVGRKDYRVTLDFTIA
jgi:hypothetical protein